MNMWIHSYISLKKVHMSVEGALKAINQILALCKGLCKEDDWGALDGAVAARRGALYSIVPGSGGGAQVPAAAAVCGGKKNSLLSDCCRNHSPATSNASSLPLRKYWLLDQSWLPARNDALGWHSRKNATQMSAVSRGKCNPDASDNRAENLEKNATQMPAVSWP